jgi:hypothetical protein
MASFREIDYTVRPAKSVERKMMAEGYRKLELGWPLASYRYIGLGSVYFSDFTVFHQALGIADMLSIEREVQYQRRFEFNRPYACVDILFDQTSNVLDSISWDKRSLVWLDYDGKLDASVIADLRTVIQNVASGSLVSVSINVEADRPPHEIVDTELQDAWRLSEFENKVGSAALPAGIAGGDLRGKSYGRKCWEVLHLAVIDQLVKRNGRPDVRPESMMGNQVFHFRYADGVPMLTVGWLIYSVADASKAKLCSMTGGSFRNADLPLVIEAPKLTPKEIRHLNSLLPSGPPVSKPTIAAIVKETGIPEGDINKFAAVYRHYPHFSEVAL